MFLADSHEKHEDEAKSKESTEVHEEHVTKSVEKDHSHAKGQHKAKEMTTVAPQTNHVSDEHSEASE